MITPDRILIIKPSSLGDVATTLPLLCDLRRAYPAATIDWLIHPSLAALVEGHDAIHELIPFDRKRLASWWYRPSAFSLFRQLLHRLRSTRYDLVVDAQGLLRSGFFARATGAKTRIGFAHAREGAAFFYTHKVTLPNDGKKMIAVDRMRALLAPLGIDTARTPAEFRMPVNHHQADLYVRENPRLRGYIAVIPGARWDTKRWSADGYAALIRRLHDAGHYVILLGSPDEQTLCNQIHSALSLQSSVLNFAGQTDLAKMIALLSLSALVIGNDSGPLHVAVALGKPVVGIYGPTDPEFVGPYNQLQNVIRFAVECHPCRRQTCDHHSCMKGVTVDLVWEKVRTQLEMAHLEKVP